jgi:AcrR family transcriptional regulator
MYHLVQSLSMAARDDLLQRVVDDVATHGIGDRSLRDLATAVGSSHRMLLYHFGSREGLVAAIVDEVEARQRASLAEAVAAAPEGTPPEDVVLALWEQVSSEELRPFVRLFFEALAVVGRDADDHLTATWLDQADDLAAVLGGPADPVDLRLGVAVVRGLLVDVVATGETAAATEALVRYLDLWRAGRAGR